MNDRTDGIIRHAPIKFAPANGLAFFEDLGWSIAETESLMTATRRFRRLPPLLGLAARLPQPDPRNPGDGCGARSRVSPRRRAHARSGWSRRAGNQHLGGAGQLGQRAPWLKKSMTPSSVMAKS